MSVEIQSELAPGYIWKDCPSIRARFPMPDTWFFKEESIVGTEAFFMTREPIRGESSTQVIGGIRYRTTSAEGHFKTGLTVNAFDISRITRRSGNAIARNFMERPPRQFTPTSQLTRQRDGSLIILRRFFRSERLRVLGKEMPPTNYYIEFTDNGSTGTVYYIMFETPSDKWSEDIEIAKTMIENRVLDKRV